MSLRDVRTYSGGDALALLNQSEGSAYFIPKGYEPILVHQSQFTDEVRAEIRRANVKLQIATSLEECRLPSYIVVGKKNDEVPLSAGGTNLTASKSPPRPPNAFILYRKAKQAEIMASIQGISNNEVSKIIGQLWHNESELVKLEYQRSAHEMKLEHKLLYPDYRYRPRRQVPGTRKGKIPQSQGPTFEYVDAYGDEHTEYDMPLNQAQEADAAYVWQYSHENILPDQHFH